MSIHPSKASKNIQISLIVPVFNRPDEVDELLQSLSQQEDKQFELIIVEDGSTESAEPICEKYKDQLHIQYFYKENTGPGLSRNYGVERASGEYCIFLDSDCVIPPQYIKVVREFLSKNQVDAFGGPDAADKSFTKLQKAINYAMTSFFTTGGIRGGGEKLEKFHPRSFNMGITKEVYEKTGGFPTIRFAYAKAAGEDLDLSIQIIKNGFKTALIIEAYVYHKRRTSLKQFARQVYNFGIARITISKRHPESLKALHYAPAAFTIGTSFLILLALFASVGFLVPLLLYAALVFLDSLSKNNNLQVAVWSVITSFVQLIGYGIGFIEAFWIQKVFQKKMF
jgi:glycosyltransferase involved in cell wall biosynthesis